MSTDSRAGVPTDHGTAAGATGPEDRRDVSTGIWEIGGGSTRERNTRFAEGWCIVVGGATTEPVTLTRLHSIPDSGACVAGNTVHPVAPFTGLHSISISGTRGLGTGAGAVATFTGLHSIPDSRGTAPTVNPEDTHEGVLPLLLPLPSCCSSCIIEVQAPLRRPAPPLRAHHGPFHPLGAPPEHSNPPTHLTSHTTSSLPSWPGPA